MPMSKIAWRRQYVRQRKEFDNGKVQTGRADVPLPEARGLLGGPDAEVERHGPSPSALADDGHAAPVSEVVADRARSAPKPDGVV